MKHLVIKSHQPTFDYYLELEKGELLTFERKPTDVAGWIWCTTITNKSCWVPETWVKIIGKQCEVLRGYCSKELAIDFGEVLELEFEESGWAWVKNSRNDSGWIPLDCIS